MAHVMRSAAVHAGLCPSLAHPNCGAGPSMKSIAATPINILPRMASSIGLFFSLYRQGYPPGIKRR